MILLTQKEMKRIDEYTCKNVTPSYELMEKAGTKMGEIILKHYSPRKVLIVCSSKGNGGDGFVVGRYLLGKGTETEVYLTSENFSSDCEKNYHLFKGKVYKELPSLEEYDLIVDALIGIGLKTSLKEEMVTLINKINASGKTVVSLDMPTGIDATNGKSHGAFIKADLLITVEYAKSGLFLEDGLDSYKKSEVIKVGMVPPEEIIYLSEKEDYKDAFKERKRNSNKGTYGRAAVIAGSEKYAGASLLSYNALSAFMMGVGYAYLYVPESVKGYYKLSHPELIVNSLSEKEGHIAFNEEELDSLMKSASSISIGMGMDVSEDLYKTIGYLLKNYKGTLIIDADGLNTVAKYGTDILSSSQCEVIITPHIGEFSRLSGLSKDEIKENNILLAKDFADKYHIVVALKSASTIITDGKDVYINASGNSSLAKAGSGDTLSGIMAGICAYTSLPLVKKAALGCFIFGKANEFASKEKEAECLLPEDNVKHINDAVKYIKN